MKRSKLLLVSAILGTLYAALMCAHVLISADQMHLAAPAAPAVTLLLDIRFELAHLLSVALAVVVNWLAYAHGRRGVALTGAILYCMSALFVPQYIVFVLLQIALCFAGFARTDREMRPMAAQKGADGVHFAPAPPERDLLPELLLVASAILVGAFVLMVAYGALKARFG